MRKNAGGPQEHRPAPSGPLARTQGPRSHTHRIWILPTTSLSLEVGSFPGCPGKSLGRPTPLFQPVRFQAEWPAEPPGLLSYILLIMDFFFFFFFASLFICFLAMPSGRQNLSSPTRDWTHVLCSRRWSLNHWATREVLELQTVN